MAGSTQAFTMINKSCVGSPMVCISEWTVGTSCWDRLKSTSYSCFIYIYIYIYTHINFPVFTH